MFISANAIDGILHPMSIKWSEKEVKRYILCLLAF